MAFAPTDEATHAATEAARPLIVSAIFAVIAVAVAFREYPHLSGPVPLRWSSDGHAIAFLPTWLVAALPAIAIAFLTLPSIRVAAVSTERHQKDRASSAPLLAGQGALLVLGVMALLVVARNPVPVRLVALLFLGVLLMALGGGAWPRTYRGGDWLFVLAGLVVVAGALAGVGL